MPSGALSRENHRRLRALIDHFTQDDLESLYLGRSSIGTSSRNNNDNLSPNPPVSISKIPRTVPDNVTILDDSEDMIASSTPVNKRRQIEPDDDIVILNHDATSTSLPARKKRQAVATSSHHNHQTPPQLVPTPKKGRVGRPRTRNVDGYAIRNQLSMHGEIDRMGSSESGNMDTRGESEQGADREERIGNRNKPIVIGDDSEGLPGGDRYSEEI
ncbi:MAG: hypothetical protein Q9208_008624 [Pyrenodesmia sp. 3 TL-2023]